MNSRQPRRRFALAAVTLSLVLSVLVLELVPRLVPGLMPDKVKTVQRIYDARNSWESMMRPDRDLGFALRAGLDLEFPSEHGKIKVTTADLGIESLGYRDIGTKPPFDAVAIGDSFTFCDDSSVEDCWLRRLSDRTGLSIANLGVNGYSNLAETRLLAKVAPTLEPKITLLGFFPNDFKDNVHFENWTRSGTDDYWTWMRRKRRSDTSEWLAQNSFLYRLFDAARRYGDRKTIDYKEGNLELVLRQDDWWWGVVQRSEVTPTYDITQKALAEADQVAKASGSRLVVLLFPFKEQVYWDIARKYVERGKDLTESDVDAPLRTIGEFLATQSIDYCDLTPVLRAEAKKGIQLYLKAGAHWTSEGNRAAAEGVEKCLADKGLVHVSS
jgi:hypothetical protein